MKFVVRLGIVTAVLFFISSLAGYLIFRTKLVPPSPEIRNSANLAPTAEKWVLKQATAAEEATVLTLPGIENEIVLWRDLLIYASADYSSDVQVLSYNLTTGEKQTIYDQAGRNDFQTGRNSRYVSDMQVIDNFLTFSVGGYMTSGATFQVSLPPTGELENLTAGASGKIQFWKNRYWLINSIGDACWNITSYSLFNLTTRKATDIASSKSGCLEGEEFIGYDKRDRLIMSFHSAGSGEGKEGSNGTYQSVIAVPVTGPAVKEPVIAKQNMPADITSIVFLEESDQLLLGGKDNYLYDFSSNSITKTAMTIPTPTNSPQGKTLKEKLDDLNLPQGYKFVLE